MLGRQTRIWFDPIEFYTIGLSITELFLTDYFRRRKSPKENTKEGKKPRKWDLSGSNADAVLLDYTKDKDLNKEQQSNFEANTEVRSNYYFRVRMFWYNFELLVLHIYGEFQIVGQMVGSIRDLEADSDSDTSDEEFETAADRKKKAESKGRGFFAKFRYGLVQASRSFVKLYVQSVLNRRSICFAESGSERKTSLPT